MRNSGKERGRDVGTNGAEGEMIGGGRKGEKEAGT